MDSDTMKLENAQHRLDVMTAQRKVHKDEMRRLTVLMAAERAVLRPPKKFFREYNNGATAPLRPDAPSLPRDTTTTPTTPQPSRLQPPPPLTVVYPPNGSSDHVQAKYGPGAPDRIPNQPDDDYDMMLRLWREYTPLTDKL